MHEVVEAPPRGIHLLAMWARHPQGGVMDTLEEAVGRFMRLAAANGASPSTVTWYGYMLKPMQSYELRPVTSVSNDDMIACMQRIRARGVSQETIRSHIRVMMQFWRWAMREYRIPRASNPMRGIRRPPRPKPIPRAINHETLRRLLAATDDSASGRRARAIFLLLASSGIRAGGLLSLRMDALDLDALTTTVIEKGSKSRRVYFTAEAAAAIRSWLAVRPNSEYVFCSLRWGERGAPLTGSGLRIMIAKLARKAGIPPTERINPHSFRHYFALTAKRKGLPIAVLARLIGHEDPGFTLRTYGALSDEEVAEVYRQFAQALEVDSDHAAR